MPANWVFRRALEYASGEDRKHSAHVLVDMTGTVEQARRVLNLLPADDHVWRGGAALLMALAQWRSGNLVAAQKTHDEGIASLEKAGAIALAISAAYILMLQAVAHHALGDIPASLAPLERALNLAEPEGYVQIFVDEGVPMRELLQHAVARGTGGAYPRRLLAAFDERAHPSAIAEVSMVLYLLIKGVGPSQQPEVIDRSQTATVSASAIA